MCSQCCKIMTGKHLKKMSCHSVKWISCRHLQPDLPWPKENVPWCLQFPGKCHMGSDVRVPGLESCIRDRLCSVTLGSNLPLLNFHHLKEWLKARILEINGLSSNPALQFHKSLWVSSSSLSRENKSSNNSWDCMRNKWMRIHRALRTVSDM